MNADGMMRKIYSSAPLLDYNKQMCQSDYKCAFPPLINQQSCVLILGTLPGEDSLKYQQYYGHQRNHFWRIIGDIIGLPLTTADYTERCEAILAHRFALWDTLRQAKRQGSLDSCIRDPQPNDIPALLRDYPNIRAIGFNGKQAERFFKPHLAHLPRELSLLSLPSTSPAYTLAYEKKLAQWSQALSPLIMVDE